MISARARSRSQPSLFGLVGRKSRASRICFRGFASDQNSSKVAHFICPLSNQDLGPDVLSNLAEFDLVALDGLDYVLGDRDWELALFDLVNAISHAGEGWLVLACDLPATGSQLLFGRPCLKESRDALAANGGS